VERIFREALAIFYLIADYSTTSGPSLLLFAGGGWARRQLPNSIRYVSVASNVWNSLSFGEAVLGLNLAIFYLTVDYTTTAARIVMLFVGCCWP